MLLQRKIGMVNIFFNLTNSMRIAIFNRWYSWTTSKKIRNQVNHWNNQWIIYTIAIFSDQMIVSPSIQFVVLFVFDFSSYNRFLKVDRRTTRSCSTSFWKKLCIWTCIFWRQQSDGDNNELQTSSRLQTSTYAHEIFSKIKTNWNVFSCS